MKVGFFIQARLGSSRLPGKVLKPFFKNKSILEVQMSRIHAMAKPGDIVVVLTTNNKIDDELVSFCNTKNWKVLRGSEENVLSRYTQAASVYNIERIIRVCSDNPFLNVELNTTLIEKHRLNKADYTNYWSPNEQPAILTHFGCFVEGVSRSALEILSQSLNRDYKEHVTFGVYKQCDKFLIDRLDWPAFFFDYGTRLTVDTPIDFKLMQQLYNEVAEENLSNEIQIIKRILSSNPEYLRAMKGQIEAQKK